MLSNIVLTAPTSQMPSGISQKPPETSESPDLAQTTEPTSPDVSLGKQQLYEAEIISYTVKMYADEHFDELLRSHQLTSESNEIENRVLEIPRPTLQEDTLDLANSCTRKRVILQSVLALVKDNIQLSEAIARSRYKQTNYTTIMALKSLADKIYEMLSVQNDQTETRFTAEEADKLATNLFDVLATVTHIKHEMDVCREIFKAFRNCRN